MEVWRGKRERIEEIQKVKELKKSKTVKVSDRLRVYL